MDNSYRSANNLIEGVDYILVDGYRVFTEEYLLKRGYCCQNFCKNCPYKNKKENGKIHKDSK